jgi:predicted membrane protein
MPLSRGEIDREVARLDSLDATTRLSVIGDNRIQLYPEDERTVSCVSLIGDGIIDLRQLSGEPGVVLVKVAAAIGDTRIIVPRGTPVDIRLVSLIGEQKKTRGSEGFMKRLGRRLGVVEEPDRPAGPPGPTVVVTGFKLIGDTVVEEV